MTNRPARTKTGIFLIALTLLLIGAYSFSQATFASVAPTTTSATSPVSPNGDGGWFKTNPLITLSADTPATAYYYWDGAGATTYAAPFYMPGNGAHTLHYYSKIGTDTPEAVKSRSFKLDTARPILNVTAPKPNRYIRGVLRIRVKSTDPLRSGAASGLRGVKAFIGRKFLAQTSAADATLRLDTRKVTQGRRLLKVVARDNAGNKTIFYRRYVVDNNKPRVPVAYFSPALPVVDDHAQLTLKVRDMTAPQINVRIQLRRPSGKLLSEAALGWVEREATRLVSLKMPRREGDFIRRIIAVDKAGNRRIKDSVLRVGNYWRLDKVKSHVFELSKNIGVRVEGSDGEHRAADYIEERLRSYGYAVERQSFTLPDGKTSYNIVARRAGSEPGKQFIVGAHYDSKSPSPGANDNGTGTGVVLELARLFKTKQVKPTMVFALFGSEERFGVYRYPEHQGSRHFVATMSAEAKQNTLGMISVDMVGVGSNFWVRSMRKGTMSQVNDLLAFAAADGTAIGYAQDFGYSDHDQFELAGIPAAWLEWRTDNLIHTTGDTYERIQWDAVDITGKFLSKYLINRFQN